MTPTPNTPRCKTKLRRSNREVGHDAPAPCQPLHTKWFIEHSGGPREQGQEQESGAHHGGLSRLECSRPAAGTWLGCTQPCRCG